MDRNKASCDLTRRTFLGGSAAVLLSTSLLSCMSQTDKRPNILLVMADDMGFSDAGCYGGEIRTPYLDTLAENGLKFTQFYNCARCCPTRASLMTGQYPHKVGLGRNGRTLGRNGITIAEVLNDVGYNTAMVGKWHLSQTATLHDKQEQLKWLNHQDYRDKDFAPVDTYPVNRGFERHYGAIWGVINFFDPFSLVEGEEPVKTVPEDYYFTDAITDRALDYLQDMKKENKPWFLYLAHCAPHWPLHARDEDIRKYKGVYDQGWNHMRNDRFQRQLELGLFKKENTPLPDVQSRDLDWDTLDDQERQFQVDKMQAHAAMVDRIDQNLGRVIDYLRDSNQLDNTVIFFLCDNGASPETPTHPGFDRNSETREGKPVKYDHDILKGEPPHYPGPETTYAGIGPAWANASNTPFRFWKKESFEGGVHTPFIVHWPRGLKKKGAMTEQVGHAIDILPTCLDLARTEYPDRYGEHDLTPLDGKSLLPVLQGEQRESHEVLYFEHEGGRAIRIGDWKLVALLTGDWELYDLSNDRTEMNDLSDQYPDKVENMRRMWLSWAKKVDVPPPPPWSVRRLKQEGRLHEIPKFYQEKL